MKVSIIVPIYQFTDELFKLSRAMFLSLDATEGDDEIEKIVIDNGSPIGGSTLQQEAHIYIHNTNNLGYCKAVNQGLKLATGNIIFVGNNDIRVSPNWLTVTREIFDTTGAGSVHFKMVNYDEDFKLGTDIYVGGKERWCHSSFYAIRREALPEGLYWEGYEEGGYDDYDFWHRVRDINGWPQAYTNKAAFQHKDSSTYMALDQRDGTRNTRDIKNRESYKQRFGEYPDVQFGKLFPEQMKLPWKPFV